MGEVVLDLRLHTLNGRSLLHIVLLVVAIIFASGGPSKGQSERPTLTVGWVLSPPLWERGEGGEKTGFFVEFAQLIADEIDHDLIVNDYPTVGELVKAQLSGETDMIAGGTGFSVFEESSVFSSPVGHTQSRIFVRTDLADDFDVETISGKTIGTAIQTSEVRFGSLFDRNVETTPPTAGAGLMALLSGEYAALIYPEETVSYLLHKGKIDHLIVPVGEPLNVVARTVVLHRSRADLLDPINDVIKRMKADGRLAALLREKRIEIYDPAPEVLTVAFPDIGLANQGPSRFAPSYVLDDNGAPSGYAIEIFRAVADRAGLKYQFKTVPATLMVQGPSAAGVDIIPSLGVLAARREIMDQTLPAGSLYISATIRRDDADVILTPADLSGRTIGVPRGGYANIQAMKDPTFIVETFDSPGQQLDALLDGRIDAALMLRTHLPKLAEQRGDASKVSELEQALFAADRAISLRFGLGQVRERLNAVLPSYLLSDEFAELNRKYYEAPVFWNKARLRYLGLVLTILGGLVFALLIAFLASERARHREIQANEKAELARREAIGLSTRLRAVMEASSNGVVVLYREGDIAMMNPRARELLELEDGFVWPEDLGNSFFAINEDSVPLKGKDCPFRRAMESEEMDGVLYQFHGQNAKRPTQIRISSSSIPLEASSEIGTVIIMNDVTEYERQRKESLRNGRLSAVGQLTGGVAHDFNNLLAIIMGNLELLKEAEIDPSHDEMIDAGLAATKRGANLTKSLLAFSRQSRLEVEVLDLNSVVLDAQSWMRRALPESISVETSLLAGVWPIQLDRSSLESALLNLIVNARDAMEGLGSLTIETANVRIDEAYVDSRDEELAVGRYVLLAVSDTGSGISKQNLDRLFEPFFSTKGPGEGSGMGLSMVQGFVKQSGGTVQVYSELGVGTTFKLYFPASKEGLPSLSGSETKSGTTVSGNARILLAEDDDKVRSVLKTILEGAGYTVVAASSGDAALEVFRSGPKFDLLVTDIVMPGTLQGTGLAKAVRPLQPTLPIIFLSGYAAEATVHGNGLHPEDTRLMKPVPKQELLDAVARRLQNT